MIPSTRRVTKVGWLGASTDLHGQARGQKRHHRRARRITCRRPASLGPAPASTGYYKAKGFNCYGPRAGDPTSHGARDLENPPSSSCGVMSRADCQARCDATEDCDGVVVTPAAGGNVSCYRKADINLAACDNNAAQFETYVKSNWTKAG